MTQEQGQKVAKQMGAIYVECSSKEMVGVHEIFELAVDTAVGQEVQMKERKQAQSGFGSLKTGEQGAGGMKTKKRRDCRML